MEDTLRHQLIEFFEKEFASIIPSKLESGHKLSKFNVNPFVLTALSSGVLGKASSENMAKSLIYPRVFGTSISTTFGDKMQKLCIQLLGARASGISGMDIEFDDKVTGIHHVIQLKAGPNTINSGDVKPIIAEMNSAYRLFRQNRAGNETPVFAIGIAYGEIGEISGHYRNITASSVGHQLEIPIFIGKDFWHKITGDPDFYDDMIKIFIDLFEEKDYSDLLQRDIEILSKEIEDVYFKGGSLDFRKN